MIDLSIVVSWSPRKLALGLPARSSRHAPPAAVRLRTATPDFGVRLIDAPGATSPGLRGIGYHGPPYRFLRNNRGRGRMLIVCVPRIARAPFRAMSQALRAAREDCQRAPWVVRRGVLLWRLRGCRAGRALRAEASR